MIFLAIIIVLNAIWGIFLIINSINFDIISQGSYLYLYDLNNFDFSLENFEQIQVAEPNRIEIKNIFFSDNNNTNMIIPLRPGMFLGGSKKEFFFLIFITFKPSGFSRTEKGNNKIHPTFKR